MAIWGAFFVQYRILFKIKNNKVLPNLPRYVDIWKYKIPPWTKVTSYSFRHLFIAAEEKDDDNLDFPQNA